MMSKATGRIRTTLKWALAGGALALPIAGFAEMATMTGIFSAPVRATATVERIAIGRFDGQDGPRLEQLIESGLARVSIAGRPYFDVVADGGVRADAVLTGATTGGVEEIDLRQTRQRCAEEKDGKCVRQEEITVMCRRRTIDFTATVRLVGSSDRRVLYSVTKPRHAEATWCPRQGENPPASVEQTISGMIGSAAAEMLGDLSPSEQTYRIRFLESRDGMPKEIGQRFKELVKLSTRDLSGACAGWAELDRSLPNHVSIVFDLAICAEARGDYPAALRGYRAAAQINPSKAREHGDDLGRVQRLIDGKADYAARMARR